jgi:hypothetical protein
MPFVTFGWEHKKELEGASGASPAFFAAFSFSYKVIPLLASFDGHSFCFNTSIGSACH